MTESRRNGGNGPAKAGGTNRRGDQLPRRAKSEVYSFVDYADITLLERPAIARTDFTLGSWGGGVRLSYAENATIGIEVADAWNQPVPGYDQDWRVALSWKLSIRP